MSTALQTALTEVIIQGDAAARIDVDGLSGIGGFTEGFEQASGAPPQVAVNHWLYALSTHQLNHPRTAHFHEDITKLRARETLAGRLIRWLHGSPDCTDHSNAKGGKPRRQEIRGLAWHLLPWLFWGDAHITSIENVREFLDWGPVKDGKVIESRRGETFAAFMLCLTTGLPEGHPSWPEIRAELGDSMPLEALSRGLGCVVEHRILNCADYGAPTGRRRLIILARRDGLPIRWPTPTHGKGTGKRHRRMAECIDTSDLGESIFGRKKELAEATKRRIAHGAWKHAIATAKPYLIECAHGDHALRPGGRTRGLDQPMGTITGSNNHALVVPTLIQTGYGERDGQTPRALDIQKPLGTIVGCGGRHALSACVLRAYSERRDGDISTQDLRHPLGTITTRDHHWLCASYLVQYNSGSVGGQAVDRPLRTITSRERFALLNAELGGDLAGAIRVGRFIHRYAPSAPLAWIMIGGRLRPVAMVTAKGLTYLITDLRLRMLKPVPELLLAQGFPRSYRVPGTKADQTKGIGNSVPPPLARAIVAVNLPSRSPSRPRRRAA